MAPKNGFLSSEFVIAVAVIVTNLCVVAGVLNSEGTEQFKTGLIEVLAGIDGAVAVAYGFYRTWLKRSG